MYDSLEIVSNCSYLNEICGGYEQFCILKKALCRRNFLLKGDVSLSVREWLWRGTTQSS
jgi:hypothetical protein